jgi:hypothetical protein
MSSSIEFNATVFVSEQLNRLMVNAAQELANRVVVECGSRYNFDSEEAIRLLGLNFIKLERKSTGKTVEKSTPKTKVVSVKSAFPLPYNGEFNDTYCYALRQNNGLYTQCQIARKGDKHYCKSCQALADKSESGVPEYGTIQDRLACGIFEYVDPKGRKPISYTKVMKKYKKNEEEVKEEAGKFNIIIDSNHFIVPEADVKRGRPAVIKAVKEAKGAKGRPKKTKKVLQIEGDDDDLFASLVADANASEEEEEIVMEVPKKKGKSEEEKEAERIAKEAEKAEKEAKRIAEKEEREAKLAAEKAEKEALAKQKKEAERLAREAKKAEEEAAKKAKEEQRLKDKAEKEAKLLEAKSAKTSKSTKKTAEPVEEEEVNRVKKIEYEGKKYLKSRNTGIIYDYNEYVKNGEQIVVGQWNESKNKIDFSNATEEEEEEEYDD